MSIYFPTLICQAVRNLTFLSRWRQKKFSAEVIRPRELTSYCVSFPLLSASSEVICQFDLIPLHMRQFHGGEVIYGLSFTSCSIMFIQYIISMPIRLLMKGMQKVECKFCKRMGDEMERKYCHSVQLKAKILSTR